MDRWPVADSLAKAAGEKQPRAEGKWESLRQPQDHQGIAVPNDATPSP